MAIKLSLKRDQQQDLPQRVRESIQQQEDRTERLIGWVQLGIVLIFGALYAVSPKTYPVDMPFQPVPWVLSAYLAFTLLRLALAYKIRLPDWFLFLSAAVDIALLYVLIWSFHIQYGQPASFYLKVPTLLYIFIFIALRALRFDYRFVVFAGIAAAVGWAGLVYYATAVDMENDMITRDFVYYMTSNAVLIGAEFDKIMTMLTVTVILGVALVRARKLLIGAVAEQAAAAQLSRFFAPEIAKRITGSEEELKAGMGEMHEAAVLNFDLRGFTKLAAEGDPAEVMAVLNDYQALVVPIIRKHGGSVDKFLGDGIMATFGGPGRSETYAADGLRALEEALKAGRAWTRLRKEEGLVAPRLNGALTTGAILFGAVGDDTRLEYTVIGDAVNLSAKLEKHNKDAGTEGLVTKEAYDLAVAQGYEVPGGPKLLSAQAVGGVPAPVDLVAVG